MTDDEEDLPIRIDHRDPATARAWLEDTRLRKPFRQNFRAAFCAALSSRSRLRILELGSGPGELAREILLHCDVASYTALDWSQAMHEIATEHLTHQDVGQRPSAICEVQRMVSDAFPQEGTGP